MPDASAALVEAGDIKKAMMLLAGGPPAWLLPQAAWPALARPLSRLRWMFERPRRALPPELVRLLGGDEEAALARLRQSYIEDCLLTLRQLAPWRGRPSIELRGRAHVDEALARGHGAIVWVAQTACAALVAKVALHGTGLALVHLSRPSHRFSGSRLGVRFLNPVQTRAEGRYLAERIVLTPGNETAALLRLRRRLAQNSLVSITAGGPADETVTTPFLGGSLTLPAGALRISVMTGAPVLPLYVVRKGPSRFEVEIEAPLTVDASHGREAAYTAAAGEWTRHLEARVRVHPEIWLGWLSGA
jgi:lauroyl/myristoyl acyltransferase